MSGHSYTYFYCKSRVICTVYCRHMDQNSMMIVLALLLLLGAGVGFFLARLIF